MCKVLGIARSEYYYQRNKKKNSYEEAKRTIFEFIEGWYNRRRIHSSIGYKIPYELENQTA